MKKIYSRLLLLLFATIIITNSVFSQDYPTNTYRSATNRLYWKNKPPYAGYWQQDIYYKIKASLNDKSGVVTGTEQLTYYNNSPDTLKFVFFHMYSNSFIPGSYNSKVYESNKIRNWYGQWEQKGK